MMEQKPYFVNPNDTGNAKLYALIGQWVRARFALDDQAEISVSEIKCTDPGCPDIDTYIYVKTEQGLKKYRIAKPLVYVRKWDIDGMREVLTKH
jgi:hypothetical protein